MEKQNTPAVGAIYTLYIKNHTAFSALHGRLYSVRRDFLQNGKRCKNKLEEQEDGVPVKYRYCVSARKFKWEKTCGKQSLERVYAQDGGWCLMQWDQGGRLAGKTNYTRDQRWEKTSCFGASAGRPLLVLSAMAEGEGISRLEYDPQQKKYLRETLYPCVLQLGTAAQSVIDSAAGEPQIIAAAAGGDFCYCTEEERKLRERLRHEIENGSLATDPAWQPVLPQEQETKAQTAVEAEGFSAAQEEALPEVPAQKEEKPGSYSVDREIDFAPAEDTDPQPAQDTELKMDPEGEQAPALEECPAPGEEPLTEPKRQEQRAEPSPSRYTVATRGIDGTLQVSENLKKPAEPEEESDPLPDLLPAKSIVISAKESYQYFGTVLNGLRQGRGRTQSPTGATAYEGEYVDDKREGFGAYYYKNGKISYVGNWKGNKRSGLGVAFRPQQGGMYVGLWQDDKPVTSGSVFDSSGNLCYAGRMEDGKRTGAGVSYNAETGTVFVGKWENNVPTGQGSAFDPEGNLIYTGDWKDGKRHGMGTEYSPQGAVLFVGLWQEDNRKSGVVYENGVPSAFNL